MSLENPKKLFWFWLNSLTLGAIVVLMANFSVVNWSWNPVVDFLYTRTNGPEFYLNHYVTGMAICVTMMYFALRSGKPFKSFVVILATVPIHEIAYELLSVHLISRPYIYEMVVYLVLGIVFANKDQRLKLTAIALITVTFCTFWGLFLTISGHSSLTITTNSLGVFIPGPMYYDPIDNIIEISSWLIPISMWYWFPTHVEALSSSAQDLEFPSSSQVERCLHSSASSCSPVSHLSSSPERGASTHIAPDPRP